MILHAFIARPRLEKGSIAEMDCFRIADNRQTKVDPGGDQAKYRPKFAVASISTFRNNLYKFCKVFEKGSPR